jgi:hypothetical protein
VPLVLGGAAAATVLALGVAFLMLRGDEPTVTPTPEVPPATQAAAPPVTIPPAPPSTAATVTLPPIAVAAPVTVPATTPATAPAARRETPPPATAARVPPPTVPAPVVTGSLRLDVDAVQPTSDDSSAFLYLQVRVDERPLRTLTLTFDGRDAFARSRKRQAFEVTGVPVGARRIALVASRSQDLSGERAEGSTQMEVGEGVNRAYVQVRFMGGRDMTVRFR